MDIKLIVNELQNIKSICNSSETLVEAMHKTNLLILSENGYSILSTEFSNYLKDKYSEEISLVTLHSMLPSAVEILGTHIEAMYKIDDFSDAYCYKIFLP